MKAITPVCWLLLASAFACLFDDVAAVPAKISNLGIYGGEFINITKVPYMAHLYHGVWCGAAIIHQQFLVTAAHCVADKESLRVLVVGSDGHYEGETYSIEKSFSHPKYDWRSADYDVGVVKLKKNLTYSDRVKPINMTDSNFVPKQGDIFEEIGYGRTGNENHGFDDLLSIKLPFVTPDECKRDLESYYVSDRMICAGAVEGKSACNGDSGGPLTYNGELIGVTSWMAKDSCGVKNKPTVFTSIAHLRGWVEEIISENA